MQDDRSSKAGYHSVGATYADEHRRAGVKSTKNLRIRRGYLFVKRAGELGQGRDELWSAAGWDTPLDIDDICTLLAYRIGEQR
jgi:hypothetical protein